MGRRIAVGFVTYNPEENYFSRVKQVVEQGFEVYVFDNSPRKAEIDRLCENQNGVTYLTAGKNVGLGFGLASVCAQAYYAGHSALMFFDQDTDFKLETLAFVESYYLCNDSLKNTYSAIAFSADNKESEEIAGCFQEVDMVINSGSLFFLENVKKMGWHNEKYFVDCVDYEFCLRSQDAGLKIGVYKCTPGFDHVSEQADKRYRLFGKLYSFRAYPMFRIKDTCSASVKLIAKAFFLGRFKFAVKLSRLLCIYISFQIAARVLQPESNDKEIT